jgi:membrane associated rhomboid family serine protease
MGIYDRDYYRKSGPSYLGNFGFSGAACRWLVAINIVMFIAQIVTRVPVDVATGIRMGTGSWFTDAFILDTQRVFEGQVWRLLTYAFLHDTNVWQHIVFNMLFLWWFGNDVEQIYGTKEFLCLYLVAAGLGGLFFTAWAALTHHPALCLGASGAVTAVLVVFACHFPTRMILVMFFLPVPIWLFVLFQIASDAFIFVGGIKSQTAVLVHLAGAAVGFVYYGTPLRFGNLLPSLRGFRSARKRPRLRVVRPDGEVAEAVAVGAPPSAPVDEQLEAKVDAVLEKVARSGQASLTDSEREILFKASEIYKRRRT